MQPQSRLLVVDRDPAARESLERWLADAGFAVSAVPGVDEALHELAASNHAAALIALNTPDDPQPLPRLHDEHPGLILIAIVDPSSSARASMVPANGVYDCLTRPLDPVLAARRLRNALAHRSAEKEILQLREELARAGRARSLYDVERLHILRILEECGNNQSRAAEVLGIDRVTLHHKLKRYGWSRVRAIS